VLVVVVIIVIDGIDSLCIIWIGMVCIYIVIFGVGVGIEWVM